MANSYHESCYDKNISLRVNRDDIRKFEALCEYYQANMSDVIRGTVLARYTALVKRGAIKESASSEGK